MTIIFLASAGGILVGIPIGWAACEVRAWFRVRRAHRRYAMERAAAFGELQAAFRDLRDLAVARESIGVARRQKVAN